MPYPVRFWHCSECHKSFISDDEARGCEVNHIVDHALTGLRAELDEIFAKHFPKDHPHVTP